MKKKLLFVFDNPHEDIWRDGFWAALNELEKDFEIEKWNLHTHFLSEKCAFEYDFVLGWGACGSEVDKCLQGLTKPKKGLCLAGNILPPIGIEKYDVVFYETEWVKKNYLNGYGLNLVHAFGVNTDIFKPRKEEWIGVPHGEGCLVNSDKIWDYISVGAFALWKRLDLIVKKPGRKLVVGYYQDQNEAESGGLVKYLVKNDVMVSNQVDGPTLINLYHHSKICYVPADTCGGGERTVLEARACGLPVEIESDNPKLQELLESPIYDHIYYSNQLKKGILSCLKS